MELLWTDSSPPADLERPLRGQAKAEGWPRERDTGRARPGELDAAVLAEAKRGVRSALEALVRHYERRLLAFLFRAMGPDAAIEDIAQDVLLRAIQALPRFEEGRAKLSSWIFQIAVHRLRDELRRRRPNEDSLSDAVEGFETSPESGVNNREALTWVERVLATLPEEQRVALVLFEFHELSLAEVAEVTGAAEATVKTRIFRAKKKLLEAYQRHERINGGEGL